MLGMTQVEVAWQVGLVQAVISLFERTGHMLRPAYIRRDCAADLKNWFEQAGVEFVERDEPRVKLRIAEP